MSVITTMDRLTTEYRREIGRPIDEVLMGTGLGGVMDEESSREIRRRGVPRTFKAMKQYVVEELQATEDSKFELPGGKARGDPMHIGAVAAGREGEGDGGGQAPGDEGYPESPHLDAVAKGKGKGSTQCYRCGGKGHAAKQCPSPATNMQPYL